MEGIRSTTMPKRSQRLLRIFALVLRVLVVVVSFDLSGAAVAATELVARGDASDGCCSDCPLGKDGKECPPGCPSCHCSHGGVGLPSAFERRLVDVDRINTDVEPPPYEASVPRAPPLPGVYRPPRQVAILS